MNRLWTQVQSVFPLLQPASGGLLLLLLLALALMGTGCERQSSKAIPGRVAPTPNAPARYLNPTSPPSASLPRARPPVTAPDLLTNASFYVLQTELSPAVLVHSKSAKVSLFAGLAQDGLSAPSHVAWATVSGPRSFKRGEKLDVTRMDQSWILVWWAGASGWTNWDSPWVVFLQHHPTGLRLDEDGLHLEFPQQAGDLVLLPLYGYDKQPLENLDFNALHQLPAPKVKIKTWEWPTVITRDPLTRIRYLAAVTRLFPLAAEESFSVDRSKDTATLRTRFHWRAIPDHWKTPAIKFAPVSPPLLHAAKVGGVPLEFSRPWFDLRLSTPRGPFGGVEGVDEYEVRLPLLQYLHETELTPSLLEPTASFAPVVSNLVASFLERPAAADLTPTYFNRTLLELLPLARSLPLLAPGQQQHLARALKERCQEMLALSNFEPADNAGQSLMVWRHAQVELPDFDGFAANGRLLTTLWAYTHYTKDESLVRARWLDIRKLFLHPARTRWADFAPHSVRALGDQAAPAAAFSRLAFLVGDLDSYHLGCSLFARELVHVLVKQRGTEYFHQHQPRHSMELIPDEVFLTALEPGTGGWHLSGPSYPANESNRAFVHRWERFADVDVARFYREVLGPEVGRELLWWERHLPGLTVERRQPAVALPALKAFLTTPPPSVPPPAPLPAHSGLVFLTDALEQALAMQRTQQPTHYERLMPPAPPSPFVPDLERFVAGPNPILITEVSFTHGASNELRWPRLLWPAWKTPNGQPWTFGEIRPTLPAKVGSVREIPLSWNTRALVFE